MKSYSNKEKINNAVEWLTALLSGDYKQGKFRLNPEGDKYCCWGVLCKLRDKYLSGTWDYSVYKEIGFKHNSGLINPKFYNHSGLSTINDKTNAGFKRIAKYLIRHAQTNFEKDVADGIQKHFNGKI